LPERGFTNYLSSKDLKLEDLIVKEGYEDFHIGRCRSQTQGVVDEQESGYAVSDFKTQYYIIVDTAPVSLVQIPC
jgi:hypothetical protein